MVSLPLVRFLGPHYSTRSAGKDVLFPRGAWVEVTQTWMDGNRFHIGANFEVQGDELPTVDQGGDGIPDPEWRRADIMDWLKERGIPIGRTYKTKTALLAMVEEQLNPPAPEPVAEVVEAEEEIVEEETDITEEE